MSISKKLIWNNDKLSAICGQGLYNRLRITFVYHSGIFILNFNLFLCFKIFNLKILISNPQSN